MKIVSIYGATKQSGNTTIAEELSLMSRNRGYKTLLVDLDIHKGDVTARLNLHHNPNISDWCEDIYLQSKKTGIINVEYQQSEWAHFLQKHPSGLDVLATNTNRNLPDYGNIYYEIRIIYNAIKKSDYDIVVIDMGNKQTSFNYAVLEDSDVPVLVVDTFSYNVKMLKHLIWDLEDVHFPVNKLKLLFNREASPAEELPETVAREYGIPVLGVLPEIKNKGERFRQRLGEIFDGILQS